MLSKGDLFAKGVRLASGRDMRLQDGLGPRHVDYAVWTPYGHRIAKNNRLQG